MAEFEVPYPLELNSYIDFSIGGLYDNLIVETSVETKMHRVALENRLTEMEEAFTNGLIHPNEVNHRGQITFLKLAEYGLIDMMKVFLKFGMNINVRNYSRQTAAMACVKVNNLKTLQFLVDAQASLTIQDITGYTCLHHAVHIQDNEDRYEIVKYLINVGCDPSILTRLNQTVLQVYVASTLYTPNDPVSSLLTMTPSLQLYALRQILKCKINVRVLPNVFRTL